MHELIYVCVWQKEEGFSLLNVYHIKLLMLELSKQKRTTFWLPNLLIYLMVLPG